MSIDAVQSRVLELRSMIAQLDRRTTAPATTAGTSTSTLTSAPLSSTSTLTSTPLTSTQAAASTAGTTFADVLAGVTSAGRPVPPGPAASTAVAATTTPAGVAATTTLGGTLSTGAVPNTAIRPAVRRYDELFAAATARYGLPEGLLAAVAQSESGGDPAARSPAGARGLMQLMPSTAAGLGVDPLDPTQAVDGAARLLRDHLGTFGSVELALAAYNAGPGAVRRHGGIPPYTETQNYVRRVTGLMTGSSS